jgi:hypothetical protein
LTNRSFSTRFGGCEVQGHLLPKLGKSTYDIAIKISEQNLKGDPLESYRVT